MDAYNPFSSENVASPFETSRNYSTSFPDPFVAAEPAPSRQDRDPTATADDSKPSSSQQGSANRSNSISTVVSSRSVDNQPTSQQGTPATPSRLSRQTSGLTSFLSRATSVTSSSVTGRVSGAVDSVLSAVDSISNQIQSAVPTGFSDQSTVAAEVSADPRQQSGASFLASKLSSATGQFSLSSTSNSSSMPVISRQRVILILDSYANTDWAQQFSNYRKLTSGASSASQSALNYLFSSTTSTPGDGSDLIEQADFKDVSVLANQSSSTATIYVANQDASRTGKKSQLQTPKIIRPEYVVVRQRTKDNPEHLRSIVTALNYCLVPMFEPIEVWNVFQDRQLVFARLLRVQKRLGKENFPLIPQIFLQTHQDLSNYIYSSTVVLPCLIRAGPLGKGKIKIENLQMLQDFASIMEVSGQSCTIEQHLDVKYDLVVQKLGTSLKLFRRVATKIQDQSSIGMPADLISGRQDLQFTRQSATRQTSLGSGVLSSLIASASGSQSQQQYQTQHQLLSRRSSSSVCGYFERVSEVSSRYRSWIDAIAREFEHKLDAFCIKIVVASNDREYIVGISDCSMDLVGSQENQEEDRRSFVELIISSINTHLPKVQSSKDEVEDSKLGRRSSNESASRRSLTSLPQDRQQVDSQQLLNDKRKHSSQLALGSDRDGLAHSSLVGMRRIDSTGSGGTNGRTYGQLGSRSKSVTVNQCDNSRPLGLGEMSSSSSHVASGDTELSSSRPGLDRSESIGNDSVNLSSASNTESSAAFQPKQFGQTFLDQTSTAFNSFQKQSLSFFKRLDARGSGELGSTPPLSAKSDKAFDRGFPHSQTRMDDTGKSLGAASLGGFQTAERGAAIARGDFKSQSIDSSHMTLGPRKKTSPPKPPPPSNLGNRQSSLAAYSSPTRRVASSSTATPNTTPVHTRQNSASVANSGSSEASSGRNKVVRQNSALSAFEPYDPEVAARLRATERSSDVGLEPVDSKLAGRSEVAASGQQYDVVPGATAKRSVNYDSASITSGDSNSTTEDTMNNLKKTFASIFGDKCE